MASPRDHITAYYDRYYAEGQCSAYPPEFTRRVLQQLCRKVGLAPGSSILDVGCGDGYYSAIFKELGYDVTGIDISEIGIRRAKEQYPGIRFEVQDATALPFAKSSFDFVFAMGVSVASTDDLQFLHNWFDHLLSFTRPEGCVAFLGGSTLRGGTKGEDEWINHRWSEIQRFAPTTARAVEGPWLSHFRLMKSLPPWLSLNAVTTQALRFLPLSFQRRIVLLLRK